VYVIRHQHVRVHLNVLLPADAAECREEELAVVTTPEDVGSVVATLNHVLGESRQLDTVSASHVATDAWSGSVSPPPCSGQK
jgi:hypothetical protein